MDVFIHTGSFPNETRIPEQLRASVMQYVRIMDNEASSPQEVYVGLRVP